MNQETARPVPAAEAAGSGTAPRGRLQALIAARAIDRRIRAAAKRENKLLADAGAYIVASTPLVDLPQADAQALRTGISDIALQMNSLDIALGHSLDKDRQDYAKASQLMRWIVVGRGILDRWILQDRIRFHRRERERLSRDLGVLVFDGHHESLRGIIPDPMNEGVATARAGIASARSEREKRLAPWNGQPLPPALAVFVRETTAFFRHFWEQLSRKLFLRVPAIGALVAGWWIANHYTDGTIERIRYSMHLGGREHMSPETLHVLRFWAPLAAAALCSYLTALVAAHVQRKYATPPAK